MGIPDRIILTLYTLLMALFAVVIILITIGMWRLYFASKPDFATIRFNKAISFIKIGCVCSFLMLEANVFFWSLQMMVTKDAASPYLYMLIINLACSPFFAIFVLWFILGILVPQDKLTKKSLKILNILLCIALFVCATLLLVRAMPQIVTETMLIKKSIMLTFTLSGSISMFFYGINFLITVIKTD